MKDNIVVGFLDTLYSKPQQRKSKSDKRKDRWHPTTYLLQNSQFQVSSYYLIHQQTETGLLQEVSTDIRAVSPKTKVQPVELASQNPDDLPAIYASLSQYFAGFKFKPDSKNYFFHLTPGSPGQQLVASKLAQTGVFPGKLIHASPLQSDQKDASALHIIDPDWFNAARQTAPAGYHYKNTNHYLKAGIATKDPTYNELISLMERVAVKTTMPLLLCGPEGSGKSGLVTRLYELKHQRGLLKGNLIQLSCAALNAATSSVASTSNAPADVGKNALPEATGLLKKLFAQAQQGILFLDDINELDLYNQANLLANIEPKPCQPAASHTKTTATDSVQLIAGSRVELRQLVREGKFREDLFARLSLWTLRVPALRHRIDDLELNLEFELRLFEQNYAQRLRFKPEARDAYVQFAKQPASLWPGNFRDLNASITRMATLAASGWIDLATVDAEIATLREQWGENDPAAGEATVDLAEFLSKDIMASIDNFDLPQLKHVIWVCQHSRSAADAGRRLFNHSRTQKRSSNDTSRLAKYLSRFDLQFQDIAGDQLS